MQAAGSDSVTAKLTTMLTGRHKRTIPSWNWIICVTQQVSWHSGQVLLSKGRTIRFDLGELMNQILWFINKAKEYRDLAVNTWSLKDFVWEQTRPNQWAEKLPQSAILEIVFITVTGNIDALIYFSADIYMRHFIQNFYLSANNNQTITFTQVVKTSGC